MVAFGTLSIRLMFNIRLQDVPKELILFSMSLEMTHDSEPYSNTVIQVVLNNFTLVEIGMDGTLIFYFLIFSMFNIGEYSLYGNLVFPIIP